MKQYLDLLQKVLEEGKDRDDRTGVGTRSLFGYQMRFDLRAGFPLVTTKKIHMKSVIHELLWFLSGDTNVKYLEDNGVKIWSEWKRPDGDLGASYGHNWVNFGATKCSGDGYLSNGVNQIDNLVTELQNNPNSRRHIVTAWNPKELDDIVLPCCHCFMQFYVHDGELSCQLYQRSGDVFLGVPFNIASYALLTMMLAQVTGLRPGEFVHTFGDVHLYKNHFEQAKLQLTREPRPLPTMKLNPDAGDIFGFRYSDFELEGYDPHPAIKADVAI